MTLRIAALAAALVLVGALIPVVLGGFVVDWMLDRFIGHLHPAPVVVALSAAAVASLGVLAAVGSRALDRSPWPFLAAPVAQLALVYGMVRSAILCTGRGGIEWRGTEYPLDELREMQRI